MARLARFMPAADPLLAIVLTIVGVLSLAAAETEPATRDPDALAYLLAVALAAPVAVRRRWPVAVLGIFLVGLVVFDTRGYPAVNVDLFGPVIAMYTVASLRSRRVTLAAAVTLAIAVGVANLAHPDATPTLGDWLTAVIIIAGTVVVGDNVRRRRAYASALEARTSELEAARHDLARQAVTDERLRMARELHDVVAHTMSAIVIQTSVARHGLATSPERAAVALETIESMSREALAELRSILGVLRSDAGDYAQFAPASRLSDLEALADRLRSGGMHIEMRREGDLEALPPLVELASYRIVQEALTNVIKHAGDARVQVVIRGEPDQVAVEVQDTGSPRDPSVRKPRGAGRGLAGMQERVTLLGGSFESGPLPGGGFRVSASLPRGGAS
jgi:signal transduction histidine kinase